MNKEDIKILDDFKKLSAKSQRTFLKTYKLVRKGDFMSKIILFFIRLSLKLSLKFELCKHSILQRIEKKISKRKEREKMKH